MKLINESNISLIHSVTITFMIGLLTISLGYISISNEYKNSQIEIKKMEEDTLKEYKDNLKLEVKRAVNYINNFKNESFKFVKNRIKDETYEAYGLVTNLYNKYKDKMKESELKLLIKEALRDIRFNDGRGYFFIDDIDGMCILLPIAPHLEGNNFINNQDSDGYYIMRGFIKIVKDSKEGFSEYKWYKPNEDFMSKKISYIKYFEPFDWIIGNGEYIDNLITDIKKQVIEYTYNIRFGHDGYFSIFKNSGTILSIPSFQELNGVNIYKEDINNSKEVISNLVKLAQNGGGFYEYKWKKLNKNGFFPKISYSTLIEDWNWTIMAGLYLDDLNKQLNQKREFMQNSIDKKIDSLITIFAIATISAMIFSLLFSKWINEIFNRYKISLEDSNKKLKNFNLTLESRVKEEVIKRREQEKLLIQQSKMASMGEMISAIAHQWRQPLNALGLIIQKIKIYQQRGKLNGEIIDNSTAKAMALIKNMSVTIDDFRDFFKPNKSKSKFDIKDSINKVLALLLAQLHNHNIQVNISDFNIEIYNYKNEFEQIILNLINNAKDAIVEYREINNIDDYQGVINIYFTQNENKISIFIKDNGIGIKDEIKDKIFEPYFSTKDESKGTGIGLYMVKTIIQNMGGKIEIENSNSGAILKVTLHS